MEALTAKNCEILRWGLGGRQKSAVGYVLRAWESQHCHCLHVRLWEASLLCRALALQSVSGERILVAQASGHFLAPLNLHQGALGTGGRDDK